MSVAIRPLSGAEVTAALDDLARLRIAVFAAWPYLYDGDREYEARYLAEYAAAPGAVLVAAFDGARIVGAATAAPMLHQKAEFRAPFEARGIDTASLFYFGESVLLPEYRGAGIGHAFFDHREEAARAAGAQTACFAAVIRSADHPARPAGYRPLDAFWQGRGYALIPGLVTQLAWKEHGAAQETPKPMQYWLKHLS
ncbi:MULTISPECIES: GNAT family N-acetyltransferase [unclassified Novosphingobium]|uniref:GNAT family N-acetyltransferase n=1 Tax=unclassified Novosphingobium TaxID=2644732 RepID=UPI001469B039|nr:MULTISPECIES: GNAT family N-acetyltransferase [unclassified Novosphingobium]NMN06069.1 GNAT superfamily N-acetyltransferase [Novosphingobium sp. SG919]NMN88366.1 GNAT superfamily N-acetyltransferase [Novosphingobium sp. SG916]